MTTARDLIKLAMKRGKIIGVDQTPSADEENDALDTLNDLLDSWWTKRLVVYRLIEENFSWGAGLTSRTIGSGGNFSTTRPIKVMGVFFRSGSSDYPARVAEDRLEYDRLPDKTSGGTPRLVFYDPVFPLGVLYAYPVPDVAYTAFLTSHKRLESFAGAAEDVDLPPGYERLIVNGLAIEMCPDFGLEAPISVQKAFADAKAGLRGINSPALISQIDVGRGGRPDIFSDQVL